MGPMSGSWLFRKRSLPAGRRSSLEKPLLMTCLLSQPSIHVACRLLIQGAEINIIDPLVSEERINHDIYEWLNNYGLSNSGSKQLLSKIKLSKSFDNENIDLIMLIHDLNPEEIENLKLSNIPLIKI